MLAVGVFAFVVLSHLLRGRAISEAKDSAALIARVGVQSHISSAQMQWGISRSSVRLLDQALHAREVYGSQLLDLTVWNRAGIVVYSPTHRQGQVKDYGFSTNTGEDGTDSAGRIRSGTGARSRRLRRTSRSRTRAT